MNFCPRDGRAQQRKVYNFRKLFASCQFVGIFFFEILKNLALRFLQNLFFWSSSGRITPVSSKIFLVRGLLISDVTIEAFFSGVLGKTSLTASIVRFLAIRDGKGESCKLSLLSALPVELERLNRWRLDISLLTSFFFSFDFLSLSAPLVELMAEYCTQKELYEGYDFRNIASYCAYRSFRAHSAYCTLI